ncbi:MAG: BrnT family toxin [Acidobacteria bacterium]|nr:BrnT family toxin [Acidobacteriota bacterium]MBV9185523.1 BrnT family toxin [Acidobacteriota bacterium]
MFYRPGKSRVRVTIEADVARHYSSPDLVNATLRQLIAEGRAPRPADDYVTLRVTWDPVKAAENLKKHRVSFEEARQIFNDPLRATYDDDEHSGNEDRYTSLGSTTAGKVLFVCYTLQENEARLISARLATRSEKRSYMDDEQVIYDKPMEAGAEETIDWSTAVRGLHFIPREKGTVTLDEDVYGIFRTSEEVNNALRMLISEGRIPHFVSDEEWYAKHKKKVTEESPSPPGRRVRRGGARRR